MIQQGQVNSLLMDELRVAREINVREEGSLLPSIMLGGISLHVLSEADCVGKVLDRLEKGNGGVVGTANLDHVRRCKYDMVFAALAGEADLLVAAGMPLVWASRLQRTPLPERIAGADLISSLSAAAMQRGRNIFLIGDRAETVAGTLKVLRQRYAHLGIAGSFCWGGTGLDESELKRSLKAALPDIIFVGLPSPRQEMLISRLRRVCPGAWWVGVGDSFAFVAGEARRAPAWMQKNGLEWAHRLCREPGRLFKQYVVTGMPFAASLLGKSALRGVSVRFKKQSRRKRFEGESAPVAIPVSSEVRPEPVIPEPILPLTGRASTLANLRAVVLLGGIMRPSRLSQSMGRSMMDLPVNANTTVLGHWMAQAEELQKSCGLQALPVRLMLDRISPEAKSAAPFHLRLRVERDFGEYRGTGGVLRDIAADYGDDDLLLVANGVQIIPGRLADIVSDMAEKGGDVTLVSHADGTPSGLMLLRRQVLSAIPQTGFVDMKEQALERIAQEFDVRVLKLPNPSGYPVRSREEYLRALKALHRPEGDLALDGAGEDWRSTFNVIEVGASVDPSARLFDSVVMAGGKVEAGAVLVRSIVCDGGVARRDQSIVDEFVVPQQEAKNERC